jgi:DNA replication protein DnaC
MAMNDRAAVKKLTEEDLRRMRIPLRYWNATMAGVSSQEYPTRGGGVYSLRDSIQKYLCNLDDAMRLGRGVLLYGPNGVGKTCALVIIAKEFRRHGRTVLFMDGVEVGDAVMGNLRFDDGRLIDRAKSVDVLVLDDFAKGIMGESDWGSRQVDDLIRRRNAETKITLLSTNWVMAEMKKGLMISTMSALREHVTAMAVLGTDRRRESASRSGAILLGEDCP